MNLLINDNITQLYCIKLRFLSLLPGMVAATLSPEVQQTFVACEELLREQTARLKKYFAGVVPDEASLSADVNFRFDELERMISRPPFLSAQRDALLLAAAQQIKTLEIAACQGMLSASDLRSDDETTLWLRDNLQLEQESLLHLRRLLRRMGRYTTKW